MDAATLVVHDGAMPEHEADKDTEAGTVPAEEGRLLRRAPSTGMLTGVCSGLGDYTRVDPVVWRAAFVTTALAGGVGLWLYLACWALLRDEEGGPALAEQLLNRRLRPEVVLSLLGAGLAACAMLSLIGGPGWGTLVLSVPLLLGLLSARARGVDLAQTARDLPVWIRTADPPPAAPEREPETTYYDPAVTWSTADGGPVDMRLVAQETDPRGEDSSTTPETSRGNVPEQPHGFPLKSVAAALIGAAVIVATAISGSPSLDLYLGQGAGTAFLGSTIVIVGATLLLGAWFGNPRGLTSLGVVAVLLTMTSVMTDLTEVRVTHADWRPSTLAEAETPYQLTGGSAVLDLSDVPYEVLEPGQELTVDATIGVGSLDVVVPESTVTEVHGEALLGSVTLMESTSRSGFRTYLDETLEPTTPTGEDADPNDDEGEASDPPTLVLYLRSHVGDVTVNHA